MAYNDFDYGFSANTPAMTHMVLQANSDSIALPDSSYTRNAEMTRHGMDLQLATDAGQITIENYFSVETKPTLTAPDGSILSPKLVNSFVKSSGEYADNGYNSDVSPVGQISEINGHATVTRINGNTESITLGTEIYEGDIVETSTDGAINISFIDETTFAVSENAKLSIDEYVFDPGTESGQNDFSVLKGMFVYTSGLIGRDDPDDVTINTPAGSIGIRGTIIAGDVNNGEITVVEGAIVLRDFGGNEITLANQFETARFELDGTGIQALGQLEAADVAGRFSSVSNVSPTLFSSINDAAAESQGQQDHGTTDGAEQGAEGAEGTDGTDGGDDASATTQGNTSTDTTVKGGEKAVDAKAGEKAGTNTQQNDQPADAQKAAHQNEHTAKTAEQSNTEAHKITDDLRTEPNNNNNSDNIIRANGLDKISNTNKSSLNNNHTNEAAPQQQYTLRTVDSSKNTNPFIEQNADLAKLLKFEADGNNGYKWVLDLNALFGDNETPDGLQYSLTPETVTRLTALQGTTLDGHELKNAEGKLFLNFDLSHVFTASDLAPITISIQAMDPAGGKSDIFSFTIDDYSGNVVGFDHKNLFVDQTGSSDYQLRGNHDILYLDNDHVNVEVGYTTTSGTFPVTVTTSHNLTDSTVVVGDDKTAVKIAAGSHDNAIYGGNNTNDSFEVHNANNDLHTGGGNDKIKLFWDDTNVGGALNDASHHVYDGGQNGETWANQHISNPSGTPSTTNFGDTLEFNSTNANSMTLDFTQILADTQIRNIEHLQETNSGSTVIELTLDQVISMTDDHNTLIISDNGTGSTSLHMDNIARADLDHNSSNDTVTINGQAYDVYTGTGTGGQTVTLFVDSDVSVTAQ